MSDTPDSHNVRDGYGAACRLPGGQLAGERQYREIDEQIPGIEAGDAVVVRQPLPDSERE